MEGDGESRSQASGGAHEMAGARTAPVGHHAAERRPKQGGQEVDEQDAGDGQGASKEPLHQREGGHIAEPGAWGMGQEQGRGGGSGGRGWGQGWPAFRLFAARSRQHSGLPPETVGWC